MVQSLAVHLVDSIVYRLVELMVAMKAAKKVANLVLMMAIDLGNNIRSYKLIRINKRTY